MRHLGTLCSAAWEEGEQRGAERFSPERVEGGMGQILPEGGSTGGDLTGALGAFY